MKGLDAFFTKVDVAKLCWRSLCEILKVLLVCEEDILYIEPSVGGGSFYDLLPKKKRLGIDIKIRREEFIQSDFLEWEAKGIFIKSKRDVVLIGNPPFGKRGMQAVRFMNKGAEIADTIGFIVPIIFRKFFIHKQINSDMRWIYSKELPLDSFFSWRRGSYRVNTEFQVWTRIKGEYKNKRLFKAPASEHGDFEMWQYNNTKEALKVFDNEFDFAVPSQGWQDYSRREISAMDCERRKQWILFKARNRAIHDRLYYEIDYTELSKKNITMVPGFRKNDIVREYTYKYGQPERLFH